MDLLEFLSRSKALRASVGVPFFEASRWLWTAAPDPLRASPPMRGYGMLLQKLARLRQTRAQSSWTCFLRNRAEIAYIGELGRRAPDGSLFSVAIFGCSTGAEAFSAAYALRDCATRLDIEIHASDISPENIAAARAARFDPGGKEVETLSTEEREALFEKAADGALLVRERWRRPVSFAVVDALAPALADRVGLHDLVLANKFLCHMTPETAATALRNLVTVVRPGGTLLVSGVDLEVRSAVARDLALIPDGEAIEALHEGDETLRQSWPFEYWGLEPLDRGRRDYDFRYAAAFTKPGANPFQRESPASPGSRRAAG